MWGYIVKTPIKTPKILQNPSFWTFLTILIILMVTKNSRNTFWAFPLFQGLKKIPYGELQWQKPHQDTQNPPKPQFLDILDHPDHHDSDQVS